MNFFQRTACGPSFDFWKKRKGIYVVLTELRKRKYVFLGPPMSFCRELAGWNFGYGKMENFDGKTVEMGKKGGETLKKLSGWEHVLPEAAGGM